MDEEEVNQGEEFKHNKTYNNFLNKHKIEIPEEPLNWKDKTRPIDDFDITNNNLKDRER